MSWYSETKRHKEAAEIRGKNEKGKEHRKRYTKPYEIIFQIGREDFEFHMGRKPKNRAEFEDFCRWVDKGVSNQIDWASVMHCAKESMR